MSSPIQQEAIRRWRLILGSHSEKPLSEGQSGDGSGQGTDKGAGKVLRKLFGKESGKPILNKTDQRRDQSLDYLYEREYQQRQSYHVDDDEDDWPDDWLDVLLGDGELGTSRRGGRGSSQMNAPKWLRGVRELFPRSTAETLQKQALERYGLDELLTDPEVLQNATPSMDLVHTLISCRSLLPDEAMTAARRIVKTVIDELERKLRQKIRNAIAGPRQRNQHGGRSSLANLDWPATIRRNLKHFDREHDTLVLERLFFFQRNQRKLRWDIIVAVDQSGSMLDSVIHSAVLAAIFTGVQSLRTRLVLFDTEVVDISDQVGDPVEVLMGVQLGGGTDIANAMAYVEKKIENPRRTMVVLISDFYEGGDPDQLIGTIDRIKQSGATLLGLAALDDRAEPDFDHHLGQQLANVGMEVGAMTPDRLADWIGSKINGAGG